MNKRVWMGLVSLVAAGFIASAAQAQDLIIEDAMQEGLTSPTFRIFPDGELPEELIPEEDIYQELHVGTTTPFDGKFFTEMWGNVVSDLDVRTLLHGYNLVRIQSENGTYGLDPSVVSGTTVTENAEGDRTYVLSIYDDLFYSDGTPITVRDYAFSMLLSIAPEVEEIGGTIRQADYLLGYEAYKNGEVPYLSGMRILSDDMMTITIDHRYLPFFYELALLDCEPYPISVIAPGCRIADDGNGVYIANIDEELEEPVFTAELLKETILDEETGYLRNPQITSGPYHLLSFDGVTVEMERNEFYKGNADGDKPSIGKLYFSTVDNADMVDNLEQGNMGLLNKCVAFGAVQDGVSLVSGGQEFAMSNYTRNGQSFISFCCERPAVASGKVRQAIAMCLDKDELVSEYVGNYGLRVDGYYGLGQWMYQLMNGTIAYPLDPPEDENDAAAAAEYEQKLAEWESLNLDDMRVYNLDTDAALALLIEDGWTLNEQGEDFDPEKDKIRCRKVILEPEEEGAEPVEELQTLDLTLFIPESITMPEILKKTFLGNLEAIGIHVEMKSMPMTELVRYYYRQEDRDCDMIYLATNFDTVFEPSESFRPADEEEEESSQNNRYNATNVDDEELYRLALDLRQTEPGDTLTYCKKWIDFQERFAEVLPVIPLYSNVYFDFYPRTLHDYEISSNLTWGQAIIKAYLSDVSEEDLEEAGIETAEETGEETETTDETAASDEDTAEEEGGNTLEEEEVLVEIDDF
ncbi:MAG: hypothetical protein IJX67_07400 [Oscillospiraceae bacterium]|nr:hypothetical protein [Oscillospiraceae bacterium]